MLINETDVPRVIGTQDLRVPRNLYTKFHPHRFKDRSPNHSESESVLSQYKCTRKCVLRCPVKNRVNNRLIFNMATKTESALSTHDVLLSQHSGSGDSSVVRAPDS